MVLSEVRVTMGNVYAGTIDIVCGVDKVECDADFDEGTHTYTREGRELPSVTQLLGSHYEGVNPEVLNRASERGTAIHKEIEIYLKTGVKGTSHEFAEFLKIYLANEDIFNSKCVMDIKTYNTMTKDGLTRADNQTRMYVSALKDTIKSDDEFDRYVIWLPKEKQGKLIKL